MTTNDKPKPVQVDQVACEICLKEVPLSEATVPEATDYVAYFCGLECYDKWKHQQDKTDAPAEKSRP